MCCPVEDERNWSDLHQEQIAQEYKNLSPSEKGRKSHALLAIYMRGNKFVTLEEFQQAKKEDAIFRKTSKLPEVFY